MICYAIMLSSSDEEKYIEEEEYIEARDRPLCTEFDDYSFNYNLATNNRTIGVTEITLCSGERFSNDYYYPNHYYINPTPNSNMFRTSLHQLMALWDTLTNNLYPNEFLDSLKQVVEEGDQERTYWVVRLDVASCKCDYGWCNDESYNVYALVHIDEEERTITFDNKKYELCGDSPNEYTFGDLIAYTIRTPNEYTFGDLFV